MKNPCDHKGNSVTLNPNPLGVTQWQWCTNCGATRMKPPTPGLGVRRPKKASTYNWKAPRRVTDNVFTGREDTR